MGKGRVEGTRDDNSDADVEGGNLRREGLAVRLQNALAFRPTRVLERKTNNAQPPLMQHKQLLNRLGDMHGVQAYFP